MRFLQQTNVDGGIYLSPAKQVTVTEQELGWLHRRAGCTYIARPCKAHKAHVKACAY